MTQSEHDIYKLNFAAQLDINFFQNTELNTRVANSVFGFD